MSYLELAGISTRNDTEKRNYDCRKFVKKACVLKRAIRIKYQAKRKIATRILWQKIVDLRSGNNYIGFLKKMWNSFLNVDNETLQIWIEQIPKSKNRRCKMTVNKKLGFTDIWKIARKKKTGYWNSKCTKFMFWKFSYRFWPPPKILRKAWNSRI